jgi:hypothetical protein
MCCGLFVLGGAAFYFLITIYVVLCFIATAHDDIPIGTVAAVFSFFALWFFFGNLLTVARPLAWSLLWWVPAYLALGTIWSLPRWLLLLRHSCKDYQTDRTRYIADHKGEADKWAASSTFYFLEQEYGMSFDKDGKLVPPSFAYNRERMVNWVLLWPFSFAWTFCGDVVVQIGEIIVEHLGGLYSRLATWMYRGIE